MGATQRRVGAQTPLLPVNRSLGFNNKSSCFWGERNNTIHHHKPNSTERSKEN